MNRFLQKPFTDPNRSVCIEQALIRAYETHDREAITKAALEAQKYVDEGGDFMGCFDEQLWDYQGKNPEKLMRKYLLRLLRDRHCDDDEDKEYIRSGWHISMSSAYRQFRQLKKKHPDALMLFRDDNTAYCSYEEDADALHAILDVPLLSWNGIKAAGFPLNALCICLPRIIRAGRRVAICDQLEDPKRVKKLVKRDITEAATPAVPPTRKEPIQLELFG